MSLGQSTFGSIRGTVQDSTGASIPSAQVVLHNVDENSDRTANADTSGNFVLENVKAGKYSLRVHQDGFADTVLSGIAVDARQDLRLTPTLNVAAEATTIDVEASGANHLNTENATLGDSLSSEQLTQLPLNSRAVSSSPLAGLALSPSVVQDSQGNIAVGGAPSSMVGFSVDGISTANVRSNGALHDAYPSSEGISETKVTAFNNNAEFAQVGDVTFTTKSGSKKWHGSAFEYFQNAALDADIYGFTSKAPKNFNAFGGSLSGPVILPGIHALRDKTFFFADYEGNRKTQSAPQFAFVPSPADLQGNLTDLVNNFGNGPVNNPYTGKAYANNTITSCTGQGCSINPVAKALLMQYYPAANVNLNGNLTATGAPYNYQTLVPIPSSTDGWDMRIDENFTPKQSVYARFSWKNLQFSEGAMGATANYFLPNIIAKDQNRSLLVSYNYTIRPNLVNEFRFGLTNFNENDSFPIQGSAALASIGFSTTPSSTSSYINIGAHPTGDAFPTFSFSDGELQTIGQDRTGTTISQTFEYTDNVTWVLGKHSLKFGVDARHVHYNALMFFQPSDDYGDFTFQNSLYTNYSFGDLLLGLPQEAFFAITSPQINASSTHWGVYGQDEWQVNSRLTLNYGLRWELMPAFDESQGDLASFDPRHNAIMVPDQFLGSNAPAANTAANSAFQTVYSGFLTSFNACSLPGASTAVPHPFPNTVGCSNVETASQAGVTQGLRQLYKFDFDPRISLAYRPFSNGKTVIRAGFGIFTVTTLGPMSFNNAGNPTSNLLNNVDAVNPNLNSGSGAQGGTGVVVVPGQTFTFPQTGSTTVATGGGNLEQANDPLFRDPQAAQWNLTLERQVAGSTLVRVSYVGMANYRMPITVDLNQIPASTTSWNTGSTAGANVDARAPYQNWTLLMSSENYGHAKYDAAQLEVDHRMSHGLSLQGNYTYAKNISNAQGSDAPTVFGSEEAYAVEIDDRFHINYDRGNVVATPRHRALLSGVYQLPFGKGRTWIKSGFLNGIAGGWDFSTVTTMQSGQWLTPTMSPSLDQSNTGIPQVRASGGAIARPDCGFGNPYKRISGVFFNVNAFQAPPSNAGRFGNCGVGILQGPDMVNINSGLAKTYPIHEQYKLRFEATFTNIINRANFAPPPTNISSATFGTLTSVLPQGSGGNRTGQLSLRLDF